MTFTVYSFKKNIFALKYKLATQSSPQMKLKEINPFS